MRGRDGPVHVAPPFALIHVMSGGSARGAEERLPPRSLHLWVATTVVLVDTRCGESLELMTGRRVT